MPDRYYITATYYDKEKDDLYHNLVTVEKGRVVKEYFRPLTEELRTTVQPLIEQYEKIRSLPNFNPRHCPTMEMQTVGGTHYFLQYHRTRDEQTAEFTLDRDPEEDEVVATFVRGVTPKEGIEVTVHGYYKDVEDKRRQYEVGEEAGFDWHFDTTFIDLMSTKRTANLAVADERVLMANIITGHTERSRVFNPEVFVSLPQNTLSQKYIGEYIREVVMHGTHPTIRVRIISDGRKAYVKFLNK